MKRRNKLRIAIATAAFAALGGMAVYAQDKYALKTPSGIAFSDFKGYEDWPVVSSARTDEVLKVIVANPVMIGAYKAGIPGNGQPFPEGSKIAKLQWKPKKSTEAPFAVDVPDVFTQAFVIEKDSKRFPDSGGWGYALFNYDAASDTFAGGLCPDNAGTAGVNVGFPRALQRLQHCLRGRRMVGICRINYGVCAHSGSSQNVAIIKRPVDRGNA